VRSNLDGGEAYVEQVESEPEVDTSKPLAKTRFTITVSNDYRAGLRCMPTHQLVLHMYTPLTVWEGDFFHLVKPAVVVGWMRDGRKTTTTTRPSLFPFFY
jgi:hypothetical protein